ncbi:unnamed protein product [Diamesa tonsa]
MRCLCVLVFLIRDISVKAYLMILIGNAKQCRAEQFCIQAVWEKQVFTGSKATICPECIKWVSAAKDFVALNGTEPLTSICDSSNARNNCVKIVSKNSPQIMNLLKSSMSPEYICSVLDWSCTSDNEITCSQCRSIESFLIKKVQTPTDFDDVITKFLTICGEMSSYSDSCTSLVLSHFDEVYNLSKRYITNNGICDVTSMCPDKFQKDLSTMKKDDIPCQLCEQFVLHLRELLIANTSEVEFKNLLDGICKQMGQFNDECTTIVQQYYIEIYQYLSLNLNASKACVMVGICKGTDSPMSFPNMPLVAVDIYPIPKHDNEVEIFWANLEVDEIDDELLTSIVTMSNTEDSSNVENTSVVLTDTKSCPLCLFAIQELLVQIDNQKNKQNIENALSKLCNHLTDKLKSQCTQFVVKYSTEIIEMIIANFTPQEICTYLKLCSDEHKPVSIEIEGSNENDLYELIDEPIENVAECKLCVTVLEIVEGQLINKKKTKEEIRHELEKSCDKMKRFSGKCKKFVDKYANQVVDLVFKGLQPKVICSMIMLCSKSNAELMMEGFDVTENETEIESKPQCVLCEFIMEKLEEVLKDKKTDEEIKHGIRTVCQKMPKSVANACSKFVDEYFMMIVAIITTTNPKDICSSLKVFCAEES